VTRTRIRLPTSELVNRYDVLVAPEMLEQFEPSGLPPSDPQRTQRYPNEIGVAPVQVPAVVVKVAPWTTLPEMRGSAVLTGGPPWLFDSTVCVALEPTVFEPAEFFAVTRTRMRLPTSSPPRRYVLLVAPEIKAQLDPSAAPPSAPQRTHWNANVIGCWPVHEPELPDSV